MRLSARKAPFCLVAFSWLLGGCAAVSPVQVGQTAGTIAGAVAAPGVGPPVGALVGMLLGSVVQSHVDKVTEKRERKELAEQLGSGPGGRAMASASPVPAGQPTRVWVDEVVHDGAVLAGHFEMRQIE